MQRLSSSLFSMDLTVHCQCQLRGAS